LLRTFVFCINMKYSHIVQDGLQVKVK
ncbi:uncharacterized protein METZ01_LOCUS268607, partial [marine metagenome]